VSRPVRPTLSSTTNFNKRTKQQARQRAETIDAEQGIDAHHRDIGGGNTDEQRHQRNASQPGKRNLRRRQRQPRLRQVRCRQDMRRYKTFCGGI